MAAEAPIGLRNTVCAILRGVRGIPLVREIASRTGAEDQERPGLLNGAPKRGSGPRRGLLGSQGSQFNE